MQLLSILIQTPTIIIAFFRPSLTPPSTSIASKSNYNYGCMILWLCKFVFCAQLLSSFSARSQPGRRSFFTHSLFEFALFVCMMHARARACVCGFALNLYHGKEATFYLWLIFHRNIEIQRQSFCIFCKPNIIYISSQLIYSFHSLSVCVSFSHFILHAAS